MLSRKTHQNPWQTQSSLDKILIFSNQGNSHPWGKQRTLDNKDFGAWHSQRPGAGDNFFTILRWIDRPGARLSCSWWNLVHPCGSVRGQKLCLLPLQVGWSEKLKLFQKFFSYTVVLWLPGLTKETSKPENWTSYSLETGNEFMEVNKLMILYPCKAVW